MHRSSRPDGFLDELAAQRLRPNFWHPHVPATLAARARLLNTGGGRKTDTADAASVAQAALHCPTLRRVSAEDQTTTLRLLAERRGDLTGERTRILNRVHGLLRYLLPGGVPTDLTAAKAAALLRRLRPVTATAACRRQLARDLLGDLRRVDARLADNTAQLRDALAATGSTLTQVHGLGVVVAAKLLGHVGGIGRFPSQDHFASYTATAPPVQLDMVFRTQRGTPVNSNHASRAFARLAASIGLVAHPHLLRRALASAMAANKEPASIIAAQLRHADGGMLAQRVYIHRLPQTAPRVAGLIEGVSARRRGRAVGNAGDFTGRTAARRCRR